MALVGTSRHHLYRSENFYINTVFFSVLQSLPLPLPLSPESENSAGTFSPPATTTVASAAPPLAAPPPPRPPPTAAAAAATASKQGQPRAGAGGRRAVRRGVRRRAALLKFRFRSLVVISRPRAPRQACLLRDALPIRARSISLVDRHGPASARHDRRTGTGGDQRVLRTRRMSPPPGVGAHWRCSPRDMQQRHVRRRPVHASWMFRAMGSRRPRLPEVLRPSTFVVWEAETSEFMDKEGLWLGVQGLRLPVRPRAFEERFGLGAAGRGCESWRRQEASPTS